MITKKDLIKISDWLWEIPQGFRNDMRVPARIYASEKILEDVFRDRSLGQLVNISTLKGIQRYGLAMPDCHQGYASPIGGVAAIDAETGIISPGMQGYDVNCLHSDSEVSLSFGTYLKIKDLKGLQQQFQIPLLNRKTKEVGKGNVIRFIIKKEAEFLYRIETRSGLTLKVTGDHPLYTPEGMKNAKEIGSGERVIVFPFKGLPYKTPAKTELVNREKITKALRRLGLDKNGNRYPQIINWLDKKNLLDLNTSSWQLPYLLKIIGFLFGDGTANFYGKNKKSSVFFYGKLADLKQIQEDLNKLGIKSSVTTRKRNHQIKSTVYNKVSRFFFVEHSLSVRSNAFTVLLYVLGVPLGNKTYQKTRIPRWIFKSPCWQQRLFLSAFFGAEMSKPATLNKFNFYAPSLNINKYIPFKENGIKFLKGIQELLKAIGVETGDVAEVEELGMKGKTTGLRLQVKSSLDNLIRFFEAVGFEYHQEKQKLSCLAVSYLRWKKRVISLRKEVRQLAKTLYSYGIPTHVVVNNYGQEFINKRFIEHSVWSNREEPRIAFNFPSFKSFCDIYAYGEQGFVIDEIEKIERIVYQGEVYDLTVNNYNHNFIADNFVVSNCGMKVLLSDFSSQEIKNQIDRLATEIQKEVPSGLGIGRSEKLSFGEIDKILEGGAAYLVKKGQGEPEDAENCESGGCLEYADAGAVSKEAKSRGRNQVGTLGSGNHFLEIQRVAEIFDEEIAKGFGLFKEQLVIMVHCGSRGLGHQVCSDYLREFIPLMENKYRLRVPDREFACVPFNSPEGQRCLAASAAAANYAWANRQMISVNIRSAWQRIIGNRPLKALYDVAHNIIKKEKYLINGKETELAVHRKGSTRAFPPGHLQIPERYRPFGQPVLIPGSMGTASYILSGVASGEPAFYSTCHGAGRIMSRSEAIRRISGNDVIKELEAKGITVKCHSPRGIAEEAPMAYKNIDEVIEVVSGAGLANKVAKLKPLAVIKGE